MRPQSWLAAVAAGALLGAPVAGLAQSASTIPPQTAGRLDALGRFAGAAPFCETLGYTLTDRDGQALSREIAKLADRIGAPPQDAQAVVDSAKSREASELAAARDRVQADLTSPSGDRALREFADGLSVRCRRAVDDPVATVLMKPPLGTVSSLSRRYVDSLLAPYNRAGWQSPYILAGGDLAEAVGQCEARVGHPRAHGYIAMLRSPTAFSPDINDTIQAWLDTRVEQGRARAKTAPPSAAQCGQLLAQRKTALEKAPS